MGTMEAVDRPLWTKRGVVEAPVDRVAEAGYAQLGEPAPGDPYRVVDRERRTWLVQGGWWYRGVYSFEPHEWGTLITYRVYNIARTRRWMVPGVLLQYRLNGTLPGLRDGGMAALVEQLGATLGCAGYVVA